VTFCTRDGGECFFHHKLMDLLHQQYGQGMYAVEYRSEHWSHPEYPSFWRIYAHVGRPNPVLRALRVVSVHEAPAPRSTQMALYSYRDHFFDMINQDEDRYYPRRCCGELAAMIASAAGEENDRMIPIVELLAMINTELNASLVEIKQLRQ